MPSYKYSETITWTDVTQVPNLPDEFTLIDHLNGFSDLGYNMVLAVLHQHAAVHNRTYTITTEYILPEWIRKQYPNLTILASADLQQQVTFKLDAVLPNVNCDKDFKNFLCSFNGADHVSRQFLTSALYKFGWFNPGYSSKNFVTTQDRVDGNLQHYCTADTEPVYRKFFITDNDFYTSTYELNNFRAGQYNHVRNIPVLQDSINHSFVNVVSETIATSCVPFVTEKFLYSVICRGLWVAYAQPGYHSHLENYYGFKKYDKLFDYRFDLIRNPVERLIELLSMLAKYSKLSQQDWHDLYLLEQDTIEYNYNHYASKDYLNTLRKHVS